MAEKTVIFTILALVCRQGGISKAETLNVTFPVSFNNACFVVIQGDLRSDRGDRMTYDEKRINQWNKTGFEYNNPCIERGWLALGI